MSPLLLELVNLPVGEVEMIGIGIPIEKVIHQHSRSVFAASQIIVEL
jgi:hypothetical protein